MKTSFDINDIEDSKHCQTQTLSPPKETAGELELRTLLDLVRDPGAAAQHVDVSPRLIVRESTGVAR
jgi:DNA-binding LacI/PurR family transcriptional regulator